MNERLIVKSFGPVKDLDVIFKKVTLFIGDQGTGKSCVAKLFSMFKWTEKVLSQKKYKLSYFEQYNRFQKMLCKYHRLITGTHISNLKENYMIFCMRTEISA